MSKHFNTIATNTANPNIKLSGAVKIATANAAAALPTNGHRVSKLPQKKRTREDDDEPPAMDEDEELAVNMSRVPGEQLESLGDSTDEDDDDDDDDDELGATRQKPKKRGNAAADDDDQEEADEGAANGDEEAAPAQESNADNDPDADEDPLAEDEPKKKTSKRAAAPADGTTAAKPKQKRAPRTTPDAPLRAQNVAAMKTMRTSENYKLEELAKLAKCAAVVVLVDYFNDRKSSLEIDGNLWGLLVVLHGTNQVPQDQTLQLPPPIDLQWMANGIIKLQSNFSLLLERVFTIDEPIRVFRDTFLRDAIAVVDIGIDPTLKGDTPVRCEMVRAAVPASTTTRLQITHKDADTPVQTIVIASPFSFLAQSLFFTMRLPEHCFALAAFRCGQRLKNEKDYIPGVTKKYKAIEKMLDDPIEDNKISKKIYNSVKKAVEQFGTANEKFTKVRKTIIANADIGDAEPVAHIEFAE